MAERTCPNVACGWVGHPCVAIAETGIYEACPRCGACVAPPPPLAAPSPFVAQVGVPAPVSRTVTNAIGATMTYAPPDDVDFVAAMRARLRAIDAELRAMHGLQKERDRLARMLAVADADEAADGANVTHS